MAEMVTITKKEYESLRAAAELVRHPEVLVRTILAMRETRSVSLEEAFPEKPAYEDEVYPIRGARSVAEVAEVKEVADDLEAEAGGLSSAKS